MNVFALKYRGSYYMFTKDINDLSAYINNKITSIIELEIIEDSNGKYWMFENDDKLIINGIKVIFDRCIEGLEGKITQISFKEIK